MQRPPCLRQLSFVDACAVLISLAALAGVVWSPKLTNAVAKATGSVRPVELSVDVTNLLVADPDDLLRSIEAEGQLSFVIRNQPAGRVRVVDVEMIKPQLASVQPDGSVVTAENPNSSPRIHARFALEAEGKMSGSGVVVAGTKLKIGVPVELEGDRYRINGFVSGVSRS